MHTKFRKQLLTLVLIAVSFCALAQQKTGNIVEYFGKEKVEDVNEGEVMHLFKNGLILKIRSMGFNSSSTPKKPVHARFLLEQLPKIEEGKSFVNDENGKPIIWDNIEVNTKNEFTDNALRSGYLYLEYESKKAMDVIFEASGHTMALINGFPHEGDHYDFGWSLIPIKLKKGKNIFLLEGGRFSRMRARIIVPEQPIGITKRDMTTPDILQEEKSALLGAVRIMNTKGSWFKDGTLVCEIGDKIASIEVPDISPMNVRKIPFSIPVPTSIDDKQLYYKVGR